MTFFERLRYTMVKPDDDGKVKRDEPVLSREELEATIARADDKERNIALVAAPVGAIIALVISNNLIRHAQQTGQSTSTYQTLTFVLLGMAVLMLVAGGCASASTPASSPCCSGWASSTSTTGASAFPS